MSLTSSVPMFVVSVKAVLVVLRAVMEAVWLLSSAAWTPVSSVVAIMSSKRKRRLEGCSGRERRPCRVLSTRSL